MKNLIIIFVLTIFSFSNLSFAQQSEINRVTKQIETLEKQKEEIKKQEHAVDVKLASLYKKKVELYEKREVNLREQELKVINQNLDQPQQSSSNFDFDETNPESAYQEILRMQKEEENQEFILCLEKERVKKERVRYLLNIF